MIDISFLIAFFIYSINLVFLSLGLVLIFNVSKVVNLAHGSFYVLGGYLASFLVLRTNSLWGIALAVAAAIPLGLLIAYVSRWLRRDVEQIFFTFSLSLLLEGLFKAAFGVGNYTAGDFARSLGGFSLGGTEVPASYLVGFAALAASLGIFSAFLYKTRFGLLLRAVIDDAEMAQALGVRAGPMVYVAGVVGAAFAVLGGAVASLWQAYSLGMAANLLIYAFAVMVISGTANIWGVVPASILASFVRTLSVYYFPEFEIFSLYVVVLLVLLFKPEGLFVRHVRVV